MSQTILLVDDEPMVTASLTRELNLANFDEILVANNGSEGLKKLVQNPNVALILSDFRMPGMDGITFLLQVQEICPDATRMILTGVADLEMATNAINLGQIFRLLLKPCSSENLIQSINAGIRQYELVTGERDLLQKTLKGSVKILTELLSAINPESFLQSNRISSLARRFAQELELPNTWEIELAGVLSRIGCVTVPPEVLDAWMKGRILDEQQQKMIDSVPRIGNHLLRNIPRLEKIAEGILYQSAMFTPSINGESGPIGKQIPIIGRILKIVIDYDRFQVIDANSLSILNRMRNQAKAYDPELLDLFIDKIIVVQDKDSAESRKSSSALTEVNYDELKNGMLIMANVFDNKGRMLLGKGTVVTDIIKLRLANYSRIYGLSQPLLVRKEKPEENSQS